jgi:hypothetical protein
MTPVVDISSRTSDFQLLLIAAYVVGAAVLPKTLSLYFVHAMAWTLFNTIGLGLLLKAQSERKFLVRHFLKHYHYPANDGGQGAVQEAFSNWKQLYNLSMVMTYGSRCRSCDCVRSVDRLCMQCPQLHLRGKRTSCHCSGPLATSCLCTHVVSYVPANTMGRT